MLVRKHGKTHTEVIGSNYSLRRWRKWKTNIGFAAAAAAQQATIQATFGWHLARGTKDVGALLPDTGSESPKRRLRYIQVAILRGLQYSTSQNYHAVLV